MDVTGVMSAATEPPASDSTPRGTGPLAAVVSALWRSTSYAARTVGVPAGVRGLAVELAYTAVHVSLYPWGLAEEALRPAGAFTPPPPHSPPPPPPRPPPPVRNPPPPPRPPLPAAG